MAKDVDMMDKRLESHLNRLKGLSKKEQAAELKKSEKIFKKRYDEAHLKYRRTGEKVKEKGPYSWEAEVAYPQAKEQYHKEGTRLKTIRARLRKLAGK